MSFVIFDRRRRCPHVEAQQKSAKVHLSRELAKAEGRIVEMGARPIRRAIEGAVPSRSRSEFARSGTARGVGAGSSLRARR